MSRNRSSCLVIARRVTRKRSSRDSKTLVAWRESARLSSLAFFTRTKPTLSVRNTSSRAHNSTKALGNHIEKDKTGGGDILPPLLLPVTPGTHAEPKCSHTSARDERVTASYFHRADSFPTVTASCILKTAY